MKRVRLRFAGREVEFVDREAAIKWIGELAERGTGLVRVVYGPEGCGKSALFKQAVEVLRDHGYEVSYISPLSRADEDRLILTEGLRKLFVDLGSVFVGDAARLIDTAVKLLYDAVRRRLTGRIALLADDVFQAVGLDKAELLVKGFLNMIEYPPVDYEKIVVIVASSEGVTRGRVGRHRWAFLHIMWNMPREGFEKLYEEIPGPKPPFEDVWKWTGGNPKALETLWELNWDVDRYVDNVIKSRELMKMAAELSSAETEILTQSLDDPDVLLKRYREAKGLVQRLIENNLIIEIWKRDQDWVDVPPPERDPELGIGKYFAWQTPMHREVVKRVLEETKT
ncbi:ATP-binding protein [Caldivirga maquilingensis]|uniref:ATPase domain-containing protein n=1 Tax=Caldivirga maquilingensis (strain ATCC 700844 / DSM 13496 / JCM 10307 / IC-167) TaxID=397948 RepID=A8M945_CALMQ|nr:ATP-binding protein [Caldivirga maquilingensis]ABW02264.1 Protein of unknown function DUF1245 [Caldivirga maquilingensis IC-167]